MTKKRASLTTLNKSISKATKAPTPAAPTRNRITAINLPSETLELLQHVAIRRAGLAGGGRPSVSAVIADLVETHRKDLEGELR
jgi:hypothetical protein